MPIITFCPAHSRRLQAFLPFKNNCGCLHSEDSQTTLSFPLSAAGEFFPFWRRGLLLYSESWCLQTCRVPAYLLPWMKQTSGLLWQPPAKNKEVTSQSRHSDRQLGGSAAQGPSIFPEVLWEGVTRDDFTSSLPALFPFFFPGKF